MRKVKRGMVGEVKGARAFVKVLNCRNVGSSGEVSYQELVASHDFRRDMWRSVSLLSIPLLFPFSSSSCLYIIPCLTFQRHFLPRHFWSEQQTVQYLDTNHANRLRHYHEVTVHISRVRDSSEMAALVVDRFEKGGLVKNKELIRNKAAFTKPPFCVMSCDISHLRTWCKLIEVPSLGQSDTLRKRLTAKSLELMDMDRKLREMDLAKLTRDDVINACYLRGLNSVRLSHEANLYWLRNWLNLTKRCSKGDVSFLLHNMVFLGLKFTEERFEERALG